MHTVTTLTLSRLNVSAKSASSWRSTLNPNRVNRCSRWLTATLTDGLDEVEANWRVTPSSNTRPQSSQDSTDHCIAHTYRRSEERRVGKEWRCRWWRQVRERKQEDDRVRSVQRGEWMDRLRPRTDMQ